MMRRGYRLLFKYDECRRPPKGRPRGGLMTKKIKKNFLAPLCLGEALRQVSIVLWRFL